MLVKYFEKLYELQTSLPIDNKQGPGLIIETLMQAGYEIGYQPSKIGRALYQDQPEFEKWLIGGALRSLQEDGRLKGYNAVLNKNFTKALYLEW